jgi:hypothetical protein
MGILIAIAIAIILIFNILKIRSSLWWVSMGIAKSLIRFCKWNAKRRREKAKERAQRQKDEAKKQEQALKMREREAKVQEREQRSKEPRMPKFFPAKFCKEIWQSLHKDDKEVLKNDERVAAANFRLGVMSALSTVGVNSSQAEEVMERMEIGKF